MPNQFFLMRHGESQANKANLIISDPEVGCRLYGLTAEGKEQAKNSAKQSGLDASTIIICSDFLRTKETAELVKEVLGCKHLFLEQGLRERYFGSLEGNTGKRYQEVWAQDSLDSPQTPFGAESPRHLAQRVTRTLERINDSHQDSTILLVSHGDTLRFLQLAANDRPLTEHLEIALFEPAEIRGLTDLPRAKKTRG